MSAPKATEITRRTPRAFNPPRMAPYSSGYVARKAGAISRVIASPQFKSRKNAFCVVLVVSCVMIADGKAGAAGDAAVIVDLDDGGVFACADVACTRGCADSDAFIAADAMNVCENKTVHPLTPSIQNHVL